MKSDELRTAIPYLPPDEQDMLRRLGRITGEDAVTVALDMDIRHGLTGALGDMGNAVQSLLLLLNRAALPAAALPAYDDLLRAIAGAASSGALWVGRSHDLDQAALLALAPEPCRIMQ